MTRVKGYKPWFLFFYYKKCQISQKFKPQFEYIASQLHDFANFGMIDVMESEMLKETFEIKASPQFFMLKDNVSYSYDNSRHKDAIREFITSDHISYKKKQEIRPFLTMFEIQSLYLERYLAKHLPLWSAQLDNLIFRKLGLTHLSPEWKLAYAIIGLSAVASVFTCGFLMMMCKVGGRRREERRQNIKRE